MNDLVRMRTILHPGMPEEIQDIILESVVRQWGRGCRQTYLLPREDAESAQELAAQWVGAVDTTTVVRSEPRSVAMAQGVNERLES